MAAPRNLTATELKKAQNSFSHFSVSANAKHLLASFSFASHVDALVFIARITVHAEVMQHHPEITLTHQKIKILLNTKETKGISVLDVRLARKIESLY